MLFLTAGLIRSLLIKCCKQRSQQRASESWIQSAAVNNVCRIRYVKEDAAAQWENWVFLQKSHPTQAMVSAFIRSFFLGGGSCLSQAWQTDWSMLAATVSVAVAGWPVTRATSCDATSSLAHYWLLLGVWRHASQCVLCLSCRRALRALRALLSTTARSFRIVGKLLGHLFIADQSRAASHAPSHFTLLAPRILPWP